DGNPITINGPFFSGGAVVTDNGTEYDGSTPRLQQQVPLDPGEHVMIIVVCDASDTAYDSGIFLAAFGGCKGDCATTTWCGDGNVDPGEDCDDGNNLDGDGCDNTCMLEPVCGDELCYTLESCVTCPEDCGECPAECGDQLCNGDETCETCPFDCGECPELCPDCGQCGPDCGGDCPDGYECSEELVCESPQQLVVEGTSEGSELADALVVPDSGLGVDNAMFDGYDCSSGTFGNGPLGSGSGVILTTGLVKSALPPNDSEGTTGAHGGPSAESYCAQMAGGEVFDAAKLTIEFVLEEGLSGIQFGYLFGSEEYPEFVGQFNDVGGVFLDGVNVAMDADGNPITINGPFFSGDQVVTDSGTEYDGTTPFLTYCATLEPGLHILEIVVCDAADNAYDSAILVSNLAGFTGECGGDPLWCGDGLCTGDEDCETCEEDCGACPPACGDGECNGDETCETCADDCGACPPECGDGECNGDETCETCVDDCGACPAECGDGECNGDETCGTCPDDCGACEPECGDGECNGDETCGSCPDDCGACPAECGDGRCDGGETCEDCEEDCGECPVEAECGDGTCDADEDCAVCPEDCGECSGLLPGWEVTGGACASSPAATGSSPWILVLGLVALAVLGGRRRPFRGLLAALIALTVALPAGPAAAEQVETQAFRPSPFMHDYFTVGTGETKGDFRWNVGLFLNYQNNPLVLRDGDGDEVRSIVEHQLTGNLLASYRFVDWLGLGFDVPVVLFQDGEGLGGFKSPGVAGIGDIRLVPRARIVRAGDGLFSLAAEVVISFPTGKLIDPYMGRNGFGFLPRLLASFDFGGRGGLALNAGVLVVTGDDDFANVDLGHTLDTRLGAWVALWKGHLDLIGEAGMLMKLLQPFKNMEENPVEALGGLKWHAMPGLDVSVGGGAGITQGAAAPDYRIFAGVMYGCCKAEPAPPPVCDADEDGDGICSACVAEQGREEEFASACKGRDKCPTEPEDKDGFEDAEGCPDPDNDKDGICDPWVAQKGLADEYAGTCKGSDKCPDDPEDKDGFEDEDGCPDADNDKDSFCDPWVPEKGLQATWEKICKGKDGCPDEPETVNTYEDDDGCPDQAVVVEKKKILILQTVLFYFNETRIKEESFPLLDEVVKVLKDNPQLLKIRIEGHTDERGEAGYNKKLSAGRVETVLNYLVDKGIDKARLTSQGFGESRPLVKNAETEEDHQKNRRVEFIILEQTE
ncbi:MAG: choice-of-anchor L domain-containing protein, partial [Deltaproteobacteria bacterium]|nr:choice-of-anchor L domain-containing protein [Deltaproteobacteria bacterium]